MRTLVVKSKREREFTKEMVGNTHKTSAARRNVLSTLFRQGADLEVIEDKAEHLLDRTRLSKLQNIKTGPN